VENAEESSDKFEDQSRGRASRDGNFKLDRLPKLSQASSAGPTLSSSVGRSLDRKDLQDLALLAQAHVFAAEATQLLPLVAGQFLPLTGVDPRLAEPVAQRLRRDAELARLRGFKTRFMLRCGIRG